VRPHAAEVGEAEGYGAEPVFVRDDGAGGKCREGAAGSEGGPCAAAETSGGEGSWRAEGWQRGQGSERFAIALAAAVGSPNEWRALKGLGASHKDSPGALFSPLRC